MRIFAAPPARFCASQLRFIRLLLRFWWLLGLLCLAALLYTLYFLPLLPLFVLLAAGVGLASFGLLLRIDLCASRVSVAFGLLIVLALWPVRIFGIPVGYDQAAHVLLTIRYLAEIFLIWSLLVPWSRATLLRLIDEKNEFLQRGESNEEPRPLLKPTLNFSRLRRFRERKEIL